MSCTSGCAPADVDFLGYTVHERGEHAGTRLSINLNPDADVAFNIREAEGELARHPFQVCEPDLRHVALNADSIERVDQGPDSLKFESVYMPVLAGRYRGPGDPP